MNSSTLLILIISVVCAAVLGVVAIKALGESRRGRSRTNQLRTVGRYEEVGGDDGIDEDKAIKDRLEGSQKKKRSKRKEPTVDELLFMAGRLSQSERQAFLKKRKLAPVVFGALGLVVGVILGTPKTVLLGSSVGVLLGLYLPMKILRGWVKKQHEDLSYYLPLMIEQISIGVSSSLDIGPCIAQIVQMADERDSHNATTDLLKYTLFYVKSGVNLEQALVEIGQASGQTEFKQALLALSQVTKFGGEVSKQLQELADSISSQRETRIESEIRKLELKATGPVSIVFLAFVMLLGLGVAAQIMIGMEAVQ